MYPIQCCAGYSIPAKAGKFEILGMVAVANDITASSRFAIVDDENITGKQGFVLDSLTNKKRILGDIKGIASSDGTLGIIFPEAIKTRNGTSVYMENVVAGSLIVYTR